MCGAIQAGYRRYVALGDSQTEGLWDGDDAVGLLGCADRLAVMVDSVYPGLHYANLAIRGKRITDVLTEQVPPALAMQPDLITVCAGMNDVIQPGPSFGPALAALENVYAMLAGSGATVVTTTFPNVAQFLPLGRLVATRLARINDAIRTATDRYGFRLVDLYNAPSMRELDTWAVDRVHASTKGHILFAAAAAEALNLPDSNHDWAEASPNGAQRPLAVGAYEQVRWAHETFVPWIWRRLRGRSSADGRVPKRPTLQRLGAPGAAPDDAPGRMQDIAARGERRSGILDP
ncbi:MAG: SGNH/GDSL hydrolase family protein [Mycobacterium sp.]|nr:SGNH/GDSL hydrolase family protein [Mycobacterium sp.]